MRTVSIKLNDMAIANIQLGFVGENNTTQVIFNCKEIFENNPNAVQSLTVTPPEGEAYPAVTTRVGDTVVWTVSSSDTAYDGEGNVQLTFTDGSEVIKTYNAKTTILESATPGGTAPDPVQNWIDEAEAVLESLDGLTVEAETLEPGSSATAEVSEDPEDGHRHIDFGIPQGEKGDTGETPSFSIGTVTTGAAGSDASASITGTDEEPVLNLTIPQGLKGDAGNGDMLAPAYSTSATYKAGEYVTYNGGLYCCISDISTAESWTAAHWRSTDFGKDASALKSALDDRTLYKDSAFNEEIFQLRTGSLVNSVGRYASGSNWVAGYGSDNCPFVYAGTKITANDGYKFNYAIWDIPVSGSAAISHRLELSRDIAAGTAITIAHDGYIAFSCAYSDESALPEGKTPYEFANEAVAVELFIKSVKSKIAKAETNIIGLQTEVGTKEDKSDYDAFNKYAIGRKNLLIGIGTVNNKYISDTGEIITLTGGIYTDEIPVTNGEYYLIYSKTSNTGTFRIHGYKNHAWVKMLYKSAATAENKKVIIDVDETIDAVAISYYNNITIPWFCAGNNSVQKELETLNELVGKGNSSRYYHGLFKCSKADFDGWYQCLATDEEITNYQFGENRIDYDGTIALYDSLVDNVYVTKNLIDTIAITGMGNVPIYEYVFSPKKYTNSPLTGNNGELYRPTPKFLIDGSMHGFERGSTFGNFLFLHDLVYHWKENKILTNIRNFVEIRCIPISNPYGFENNTYANENSVNINRNFPCSTWKYEAPGAQGSGEVAGDQPETQMLMDWVNTNSDALAYLCVHTNGRYYAVGFNEMNSCLFPNQNYGDDYTHRFFNVINRHIEKQTLIWQTQYEEVTPSGFCGHYQATSTATKGGTVDIWSLENANVVAMTIEGINGLRRFEEEDPAVIPLFGKTAMKINAEIVGNFIADLLHEYCQ